MLLVVGKAHTAIYCAAWATVCRGSTEGVTAELRTSEILYERTDHAAMVGWLQDLEVHVRRFTFYATLKMEFLGEMFAEQAICTK